MSGAAAPIDDTVLEAIRTRVQTHSLIGSVATERTGNTLSLVRLECDIARYPDQVNEARLEVRWYTNGDYL